jgi:energy-coupling factor transporter ATP-binding protein EcfA2
MLGQFLLATGALSEDQLKAAEARQTVMGGHLSENLLALELLAPEELQSIVRTPPKVPVRLEETGLTEQFLLNLVAKALYVTQLQTIPALANLLKLTHGVVDNLLGVLKQQGHVEVRGAADERSMLLRYAPTARGQERARAALKQSHYVGPAPVCLRDFNAQADKQAVSFERPQPHRLHQALSMLVLPDELVTSLGHAMCSGQAILLYGPPGNGKSSVARALGGVFSESVYVPHAIEVDGQVIKVFDPSLHEDVESRPPFPRENATGLSQYTHDPRWVLCRRPTVVAGGELTLRMLDLEFDEVINFYEAPLQVKATGGILVIDDFGRQRVPPDRLLNRWIVPLERRFDYLTLHTGKKFQIVFDCVVIFSTNLPPRQLMDDALLRRVYYKMKLDAPDVERYRKILERLVDAYGLVMPEETLRFLLEEMYSQEKLPLANFHPKFIVEHIVAAARYNGTPPVLSREAVLQAIKHLVVA